MSVIDQIGEVEQQVLEIRKEGTQKITRIQQDTDLKRKQMKEHFAEELIAKQNQLEQEMLQRLEQYKLDLQHSQINIKTQLENNYQKNQQRIIEEICRDFWRN